MAARGVPSIDNTLLKRCCVLCVAALSLFAQAPVSSGRPEEKAPAAGAATFKSATNLVEVTAVVRNGQGKAAGNLTADDFQLFDTGARQAISHFEMEKLEIRGPTYMREGNSPAAGGHAGAGALPNRFVAFLVDDQNLVPERFPMATVAAIRHLPDLGPGDRAAVYATSGRMEQGFTGDRDKLRNALSRMGSLSRRTTFDVSMLNLEITCRITYLKADLIGAGDMSSLNNCVPRTATPAPVPVLQRAPPTGITPGPPGEGHQISLENQVRAFAESVVQAGDRDVQGYFSRLAELIDTMSRMPGERSILVLSPGMYVAPRFRVLQERIIAEAVRARVAISGIDPRGVYLRNDPDDPSTWTDQWGRAEMKESASFMEELTSGTGGRFVRGDNDIHGAIRRLDSTPEFVYVLGYTPSPLRLDGKYHVLKVTLKRPRGLTVEARRGYYAADNEPSAADRLQRQIQGTFFSNRELHDIPVTLQLRSSHKADTPIVLTAIARIDVRKVLFRKEEGANRSELRLMVGVFDLNGTLVKDYWQDITLHPGDEELETIRRSGIEVRTDFDVVPGRYMVRLLVYDEAQAMGTHSAALDIRP